MKVTIKKDSEAAKELESLKELKQKYKEMVESGELSRLQKIYQMAEKAWEGCDGCDENDKYFFMKGFQAGYNRAKPDELSDEEIEKAMEKHINNDLDLYESLVDGHISYNTGIDLLNNLFIAGAKWYREQLKQR